MRTPVRFATLIALGILPSILRGELLPVRTYTTADGLASDRVNCIVPDSRGFLWFCTPEGLSRFDGYRFISYTAADGLAHVVVTTVLETRSGAIFAGTADGISRINPPGAGTPFTRFAPGNDARGNYITALRESAGGRIWCATRDALYDWDGAQKFRRVELRLSSPQEQIYDVLEDRHGVLWIATSAGLYGFQEGRAVRTFTERDGIPGDYVRSLQLDSQGRLWAAARNGVALFEAAADGGWKLAQTFTQQTGLAGAVPVMAEAPDAILWVGTTWGISRIVLAGGPPRLLDNIGRERGLSDHNIRSLAFDPAGNLWVGTSDAGVMRIDRLGFTTYREQDGLPTDRMWALLENRAGDLIALTVLGAARRSVNLFDGARFRAVRFPMFNGHATWVSDRILLQSRAGDWWAATAQGLCRFPAGGTAALSAPPRICYAPGLTIYQIFEDSKGGIWASAQSREGDQLMRWDLQSDSLLTFPRPRFPGGPTDDAVKAFAEDPRGNIWMGLVAGGLYRYDGQHFLYLRGGVEAPGGSVNALLWGAGGLWIGTDHGGLGRIRNPADSRPRIEIYNTARGMASDIVTCLVEDAQGRIYAGTAKGVDRLDPKTAHIGHFSSVNGLAQGQCMAAMRDRAGSLWFATTQGLSRLTPTAERSAAPPRVYITDLRMGGKVYAVSQGGETHIGQLELKPSENQLQVDFVGIDYEPGDVVRYSYRLEGADAAWSPPRVQHAVNYATIEPGTYRFRVKAVTYDGAESAEPAEVDFTVLRPVWRRWWFESLALALACGAMLAAHRYRVAQAVKLERVRTAIATDLHDDIGASLSQIAILTEVARMGGRSEYVGDPLERAAALARELVDSMSDIVWSIHPERDGMDSLVGRMRDFALDLLSPQGMAFDLRTPPGAEDLQFSLPARRQLLLMFKECIHNAARHSLASAVTAELRLEEREVVLAVEDNGIGANGKESGGTGIEGLRRRAASLGGHVEWISRPGEGCRVTIRVPRRRGTLAMPRR